MTEKLWFDFLYIVVLTFSLGIVAITLYSDIRNPINFFLGLFMLFGVGRVFFVFLVIENSDLATGYVPIIWIKAAYLCGIFLPVFYLYFAKIFSGYSKKMNAFDLLLFLPVPILSWLLYTPLLVRGSGLLSDHTIKEYTGPLFIFYIIYFFVYFLVSFCLLAKKYFVSTGRVKMQSAYILFGTTVPVSVGGVINIFMPFLGYSLNWQLYKATPLTTLVFVIFAFAAIFKYKFMEFHYAIGKGLFFATLASLASIVYFSILFFAAKIFQGVTGTNSFITALLFFFILVIIFDPIRTRLEKLTDKLFLRSKLDFEVAIMEITSSMSLSVDSQRFLAECLRVISKRCSLSGAAFFVLDEKHGRFEVKNAEGLGKELVGYTMTHNYPLIDYMNHTSKPVVRRDAEKKIGSDFISPNEKEVLVRVLDDMQKTGSYVCVPGMVKGKTMIILSVGSKISGDDYDAYDIGFFVTVTNQVAIFLENSILLDKEKEAVRLAAETIEKEKHVQQLEKINKDLVKTREELAKAERIATSTRLSISLQHEINNPLTSVLALTQALLIKISKDDSFNLKLVKQKMKTVEEEARRIKQLLERLSGITDPIVREYMPGVEMIDLNVPEK